MNRLEFLGLVMTTALCGACFQDPARVRSLVPSPSGKKHAAILVDMGSATVGATTYVVTFRGDPPALDSEIPVDDLCYVWRSYRVGLWKVTWESESQLALAVRKSLTKDYEKTIRLRTCDGVSARWYLEDPEGEGQ